MPDGLKEQPGVTTIICRRGSSQRCKWCGRRSTKLCDFPVQRNGKQTTCDAPMCERCAQAIASNVDYCPPHFNHHRKQKQESE